MVFEQLISILGSQAVFAVYLPFLLIFSIFYAILARSKIFGDTTRVNALIAFIMALYVAAYSPASATLAMWFASVFTSVGVTLVSILSVLLIVLMLLSPIWDKVFAEGKDYGSTVRAIVYLGIIIGFLVVLGSTYGMGIDIPGLSGADVTFLILVVITLLILWFITGAGPKLPSGGMVPIKFG